MKELKNIPKENPFRVPDDYFSSLNERISSSISGIKPEERREKRQFRITRIIAIAASVTILVAAGVIAAMIAGRDRTNPFPRDISIVAETFFYDIDILTIEERVAEKDILPAKTGVNKSDIIDYLLLENIDETDIYEKIE